MTARPITKKLTALVCAAALMLCIAGCQEKVPDGDGKPAGSEDPVNGSVEPTPAEILSAALDATYEDLTARFEASPLAGFKGMVSQGALTAEYDITVPDDQGDPLGSFSGTAVLDTARGTMRAGCALPPDGTSLELWYSPEFCGISGQVFKDGAFYGLRPYGLREQLEGTDLAGLFELDMDAVSRLDEILGRIPGDVGLIALPEFDSLIAATKDALEKADLTAEKAELERGGRKMEGLTCSATLSAGELADYLGELAARMPGARIVYGLITGQDSVTGLDAALEEIRGSGAQVPVRFTVAEGKLWHISAEYRQDGSTVYVEAELYGDSGSAVELTVEPYFRLSLDLSDGVVLTIDGESKTDLNWSADGTLEFITYRYDITDLCLEGKLTAENGRVSYDGIWYSGERGDRNPMTLRTSPGGTAVEPQVTKNLAELSTRQLYETLLKLIFGLL